MCRHDGLLTMAAHLNNSKQTEARAECFCKNVVTFVIATNLHLQLTFLLKLMIRSAKSRISYAPSLSFIS
jgi:hypothetical protein